MSTLDNALQALLTKQVKLTKVWENASPGSAFAAQTIRCNTTDAIGFLIVHTYDAGRNDGHVDLVLKGFGSYLVNPQAYNQYRPVSISGTGVVFLEGYIAVTYGTGTSSNTRCTPTKIYKIQVMPE